MSRLGYGKPNGAKFKTQNWPHVQQICYQGQLKDFNQGQQNHSTFNRFSLKTFRFKVNKIKSSLSANFLSRARHIWVKLKRLIELLSKKNFSQFQASFQIILNPKFPVTFQQPDLSRSSRRWRDAQRSQSQHQQLKYVVNNHVKHCQQSS